jgi:hypothetical protein
MGPACIHGFKLEGSLRGFVGHWQFLFGYDELEQGESAPFQGRDEALIAQAIAATPYAYWLYGVRQCVILPNRVKSIATSIGAPDEGRYWVI